MKLKIRIIGLIIQTLIWILFVYIYFNENSILIFPNYLVLAVLIIIIVIYFNEFLVKSLIYKILSIKRRKIRNKMELIHFLTSTKLYMEVYSKAFHFRGNEEIITFEKTYFYEFEDVKDQSVVKSMPLYYDDKSYECNQLIVLDINLSTRFSDYSCQEELDACINKIKTDVSFKDKYFETKKKFILKGMKDTTNVFSFENSESVFLNKYLLIISYFLLIGEFVKMIIDLYIAVFEVELVKQITRTHANKNIGKFVEIKNVESIEEIGDFNLDIDFDSYHHRESSTKKNNIEYYYIKGDDPPKIENFDAVFDENSMTPLITKSSLIANEKQNIYLDFRNLSKENLPENELDEKKESDTISFGGITDSSPKVTMKDLRLKQNDIPRASETTCDLEEPSANKIPPINVKDLQTVKESETSNREKYFITESNREEEGEEKSKYSPRFIGTNVEGNQGVIKSKRGIDDEYGTANDNSNLVLSHNFETNPNIPNDQQPEIDIEEDYSSANLNEGITDMFDEHKNKKVKKDKKIKSSPSYGIQPKTQVKK